MSDKQTSTLQSYIDSASGAAQSALGSLMGTNGDKVQGEQKKDQAEAKKDLSHAGGSVGPFDVSASGVNAKNEDRTEGSWNQTVGAAKETVGGLIGAEGLKQEGIKQNQEGKGQEAQGQISDFGKGVHDRVTGTVGGAVAGLTGNDQAKAAYENQHDLGKTSQRGVEAELQKQAEAQKH
ncbi:hypothetical protein AAFC00_004823 [Neodothiora populina]|uniref:CsbD-like domain-containing protein n=1 Tax=Neodothiora populina TaxID=2781224 RepID=A0ABR3P4N6_9PEZI